MKKMGQKQLRGMPGMKAGMTAIAVAVFTLCITETKAVSIEGDIQFKGNFTHDGSDLGDATEISSFYNPITGLEGQAYVSASAGDFSSLALGDTVTMAEPLIFEPGLAIDNPLWSVGGFEFHLESINVELQDSTHLNLEGTGIIKGSGYEDTPGSWNFSGDANGALLSFSSGSSTTSVPDNPSAAMLLGLGCVCIGMVYGKLKGA
jgi:hypothetical protein